MDEESTPNLETDEDLVQEIIRLHKEEGMSEELLIARTPKGKTAIFLSHPYLGIAFNTSDFRKMKLDWPWHTVVELALHPEKRDHMYNEILRLIRKHTRNSQDKYFKIEEKNDTFTIPPIADFNRLEILYLEFFRIFQNIKNQINFENPKKKKIGVIRGKINWSETIKRSPSKFPIDFVTSISQKQFVTPENILLIICANWLYRDSRKLLAMYFEEQLGKDERILLFEIYEKSKLILEKFPFRDVIKTSKIYEKLENDHSKILTLEKKTRQRIYEKNIRNIHYTELLKWIDHYRELSIQKITGNTPTKNRLRQLKDVDTMYEVWVFLAFADYLYEKNILTECQLNTKPNCKFNVQGKNITFWYEKEFQPSKGEPIPWAVTHRPDFIAMIDDERLAVFDAKNYGEHSQISDPKNKMLSYMNNLNVNFGALIFPYHPKDTSVDESKFESSSIHKTKVLALCKMTPERDSHKINQETLDFIFESIKERIPLTTSS